MPQSNTTGTDRRAVLKDALRAVEDMQARIEAADRARSEPIAVIGLACRFPGGADTPEAFWDLLRAGTDAVTEVPADRWHPRDYADLDPVTAAGMPTQYGGFLSNVERFDPHFFGIAPREALTLDPQQRLVLEVVWEALERAGQAPDGLRGSQTGVYVGITGFDFAQYLKSVDPGRLDVYTATGTAHNSAAGRVAYTLGLQGPAMAVDTACSSALTAIHLACQSLRLGESNLAIAGGVQVMLLPDVFVSFHKWGILSPDGRCKTFDETADGFVRAEGCGIVVLKRLSDAIAEGDTIHAVVRGSAVNQDGASSGLTVPNGPAQEAVLRQALRAANIAPVDVAYVEAHGTGTMLGDPIELEALDAVLNEGRSPSRPLTVGSVKTNLGHLEAAAGIAGFIKLVLAVEHGEIPAHLHFTRLSSKITLRHQPVVIPTSSTPWPAWSDRRVGGVSAFGFCGTNVHVVVEQAPPKAARAVPADGPAQGLMLSAKSERALQSLAGSLDAYLVEHPSLALGDVAFTLNTGRARFPSRATAVARTMPELREQLRAISAGQPAPGVVTAQLRPRSTRARVAFLFTGQGSQYVGMGRELYTTQPVFRDALDRCARLLDQKLRAPLLAVLHGEHATPGLLDRTDFTQPALFALEYSLAELWRSWGVVPGAVLGHSVGEYAAACVAGVFSLDDGLQLIATRARLMAALDEGGSMVAVMADEARVRSAIGGQSGSVAIAAVNGPSSVVISGASADVASVQQRLDADGIRSQKLTVSHAFHSALMEPMLEAFGRAAAATVFSAPRVPLACNLTGEMAGDLPMDAAYWVRHVRQAVRFKEGIEALRRLGYEVFVEIGPGTTLTGLGRACADSAGTWLSSLGRGRDDGREMLSAAAALAAHGVDVDWKAVNGQTARRKIALPTYPFERERFWIDRPASPGPAALVARGRAGRHRLLTRVERTGTGEVRFEHDLTVDSLPFLRDHVVHGATVVPATAYVDVALSAAEECLGAGAPALVDLSLREPLALRPGEGRLLQVRCVPDTAGRVAIDIVSRPAESRHEGDEGNEANWQLHASVSAVTEASALPEVESLESVAARCIEPVDIASYRSRLRDAGLDYGPAFTGLTGLLRTEGEALGEVVLPEGAATDLCRVSPVLLDACFQALGAALPRALFDSGDVYVPVAIDRAAFTEPFGAAARCHVVLRSEAARSVETIRADIRVFGAESRLIGSVEGLAVKRATPFRMRQSVLQAAIGASLYEIVWRPAPALQSAGAAGRWMLWGDEGPLARAVERRLSEAGCLVDVVPAAVAANTDGDVVRNWWAQARGGDRVVGVIHLLALGARTSEEADAGRGAIESLIHLASAASSAPQPPRLWIVTQGAQAVRAGERVAVEQAPAWGLGRTLAAEQPDVACVSVDLEPGAAADECAAAILGELSANDREDQVAYRAGTRHVARLVPRRPSDSPPPRRLEIADRGVLEHLAWKPMTRRAPGPGEVEVRVAATGMNFRDVLNALGVYAGGNAPLGNECAGVVTAVGDNVTGVATGDRVLGLADDCFADYAVTSASLVTKKPASLSWGEAAAVPIVFITADYGLRCLANLGAGERVLIHAATGGVGLAAVQFARQIGAEIFATAGSADKQAYLRGLGVKHVYSSRTPDFAPAVRAATGGAGVDVVLNSLTGDFITENLKCLAPQGRFVEIGKAGIWSPEQIAAARPDVRYWRLYLGDLAYDELGVLLRGVVGQLERGSLQALPHREFSPEQVVDAFRYMAQARHIGKVVVLQGAPAASAVEVRPEAGYLITGGTGGLGLVVARALVDAGARRVVLVSRRGLGEGSAAAVNALRSTGAEVEVVAADVATRSGVDRAVAAATKDGRPLRGIVHAAGIVDDGVLTEQSWARVAAVFAPKVAGAWHLHHASVDLPLDFFVMFSSTASVLGTTGQGAYAAANACLDALAHHRRARGLPAVSINWGPWGETGMATAIAERDKRRWREHGVRFFSNADGIAAFNYLASSSSTQAIAIDVAWPRFADARLGGRTWPFISALTPAATLSRTDASAPSGEKTAAGFPQQLAGLPPPRRAAALRAHISEQVRRVLALEASYALDPLQGLSDLGMDSLMAVELRNRLQSTLGARLPATVAFDCPTIEALAEYAGSLLEIPSPALEPRAVRPSATPPIDREAIAIVGMACRFPGGADSPEALWNLLRDGVDAIGEIPRDRWDIDAYYDPDQDAPGKMYTRRGGFVEDVDRFDASFFGISAREARSMDPQQRMLLETSWEALEHAGTAPDRLRGSRTGIFVGVCNNDYATLYLRRDVSEIDAYFGTGNAPSVAAGRLSYVLGVQGPSLSIDTACSSSLVTVHLALQSLRRGECDLALAGGVNLMLSPAVTVNFSRARMLAADGRCKTFDAAADGYVRSEGCGVVVLKRHSEALADGDRVVAIIRGSAVNQDGRSSGLTVPNGPAQQAVVREALQDAGIEPSEIGYIEAHGTGTALGDPIELQALSAVLSERRPSDRTVAIGSVKTNIGHLEAAAGVAGLIKTALALQHGEIPAHLHFTALNPQADMAGLPWVIPTSLSPWPAGYDRQIAGVSSFGFSGTNAHVVMEAAPVAALAPATANVERPLHVLALSAKTAPALEEIVTRLDEYVAGNPDASLADIGFTANTGRSHFGHRLAVVAASTAELRRQLAAVAEARPAPGVFSAASEQLERIDPVFLFAGEGSTSLRVGTELYDSQDTFRRTFDRCERLARPFVDQPLASIFESAALRLVPARRAVHDHAALFALEYSLAEVWRSWGVSPAVVAGSGVGEYAAACVSGVFSLEDALRLVVARAVFLGQDEQGRRAARAEFERIAEEVTYAAPSIDFIPNMDTGTPDVAAAGYWIRQVGESGLSAVTLDPIREAGRTLYVEIGPGASVVSSSALGEKAVCVPSLQGDGEEWSALVNGLARLYVEGVSVDWLGFDREYARRRVALPTYPFQRQRYWIEDATPAAKRDERVFEQVEEAGRRQSLMGPFDLGLPTYAERERYLDRLTSRYVIAALRRFGAFARAQERHSVDSLLQRFEISPIYRKQIERWLDGLAAQGFLVRQAEMFECPAPLPDLNIEAPREDLGRGIAPLLQLIHRCGAALADVLTGKESALETLFPGGSFELAEFLYEKSADARYASGIVRAIIEAEVVGSSAGTVNILEVGAGTGGTTAAVLPGLPPERAAYWFTDVSDFFLARAKRKFAAYPFVRYGLLDFEQDPQEQGYPPRGFDVVFGANAIHATADLGRALQAVRSLLAPGGLLVLLEVTREQSWLAITTGLTEGWQKFTDGIRDDSPLLSPDKWREVLTAQGFDHMVAFPEAGSPAAVLGLSVLIARNPSLVPLSESEVASRRQLEVRVRDSGAAVPGDDRELAAERAGEFRRRLETALDADRDELLVAYVRDEVTAVLGEASGPPDRRHRLMDLGLDSLMALELRNRLAAGLALTRPLSATLMFDYPTIDAIAAHLAKEIGGPVREEGDHRADAPAAQPAPSVSAADLAELSDEEVEELLIQRLEN